MTLTAATRLGHYEIVEPIGAGGMGEIYRAHDTKLDRDVAIKALPERLARSPHARARFEREAKAVAALSHPNILAIHDFGRERGISYAVTELLEGETLRARLENGALPPRKAVDYAHQMTQGLAAAHAKSIVHRDLKPENVFVTRDGQIKILDFGLATTDQPETASVEATSAPTRTRATEAGLVLGTVGYMSPEQARGRRADHRSDVFSLGAVLYELLSGRRAFRGESSADTISAILKEDPPALSEVQGSVSPALEEIVRRCLEKSPEERFQSARDLGFALQSVVAWREGTAEADAEPAASQDSPSIVVLPFADMSPEQDQKYFCDGMADEVINALTKLEGLHVVARTSAFQVKKQDLALHEIGEKLRVGAVLEGSVRKADDRLRVTAQLVDVTDGYHLWSERYDRELADVFAIQDEISESIVGALKIKLAVGSASSKATKRPANQEAYDLYLRGMHYYLVEGPVTVQGSGKAIDCFEQAVALDPDCASAHAGLAMAYTLLSNLGFLTTEEALPKADAAAIRAVELDDSLADAHQALTFARAWLHWDWEGAERAFRRTVELNPGHAAARVQFASGCLGPVGRTQEALAEARRAHALDPLAQHTNGVLGEILYWDRQYDEAIRQTRLTVDMAPDLLVARELLAWIYASSEMPEQALRERQEILRRTGRDQEAQELEAAYAEAGEPGMLRWYIDKAEGGGNRAWNMALLHARLGDTGEALDWLEEAVRRRVGPVIWSKVHPWLDSLRPDPRFEELLKQMDLCG